MALTERVSRVETEAADQNLKQLACLNQLVEQTVAQHMQARLESLEAQMQQKLHVAPKSTR